MYIWLLSSINTVSAVVIFRLYANAKCDGDLCVYETKDEKKNKRITTIAHFLLHVRLHPGSKMI